MGLVDFVIDLGIFSILGMAFFWGIATFAFANWSRLPYDWAWGLGGAMFPLLGFGIAVVMHFTSKSGSAQAIARQPIQGEDLW